MLATDPPYYDNVGYADLADFFYVWLRRSMRSVWPELFRTVLTPKSEELIVNPYRYGGDHDRAEEHFREGMRAAFRVLRAATDPGYPASVFYAFKQTDSDADDDDGEEDEANQVHVASRGWETILSALVEEGFQVAGTWPMRTERKGRSNELGTNALASSIVLVCRPRPADAPVVSRQDFVNALRRELPAALDQLTKGGIAAVDLQQAAVGPGMAVFSRYKAIAKTESVHGRPVSVPMSVREALQLINHELDAYLTREQGELDDVSRFCLAWFEEHGFEDGPYGEAEVILRARNSSERALQAAEVAIVRGGVVQLLPLHRPNVDGAPTRKDHTWPRADGAGVTVWGAALRMAAALGGDIGSEEAGRIYAAVGPSIAEAARDLAYRLFSACERKGLGDDAQLFNELVSSWQLVRERAARAQGPQQRSLF